MRRTWVAVLASFLWLACGGDDTNPFEGGFDAGGGGGGSAGAAGRRVDASNDRTGAGGSSAGAGMGGSGGALDASDGSTQERDANAQDVTPDAPSDVPASDGTEGGVGGGHVDAGSDTGGAGGGVPDAGDGASEGAATDASPDVSVGSDAAGDAVSEDGRGEEPGCSGASECPAPANECLVPTCVDGGCGTAPVALGTAVSGQLAGDCKRKVCDGHGGTQDQNDDSDVADDGNVCTLDGCSNGTPTHVAQLGKTCGTNGVCNGSGQCVGCNVAADCPGTDTFCQARKCDNGMCGFTNTGQGTALPADQQTVGDCTTKACNGNGGVEDDPAPSDIIADSNPCTQDLCNGTTPTHPPEAQGTACPGNKKCDGAGACVECLAPSDCGSTGNACVYATCSNDHHCGTANADSNTNCGQGPSCSSGLQHLQDKCNGSGVCVPGSSTLCSPFVCGATTCNKSCSDDNGCATANVCDTGLASCIPAGTPKCTDYCNTIQSACTGPNQEYPSSAECLHTCAGMFRTDAVSSNTVSCRSTHATLALSDAGTHCPHAGPAGDGTCGANCESFCTLAAALCTGGNQQYASVNDCTTACNLFSMTPARYTTAVVTGNTFACRMFHLTLASVDPGTHCPHIAPVSATCF